jgi:DNA-binding NarL/FixJ family response regulator
MKRILIVDNHEVVRAGVKRILGEQLNEVRFGEAGSAPEALTLVREEEWDVVVLDLSLTDGSGLDVLKELKQIRVGLPVLILSMHSDEHYVRRALKAGAAGYVTKNSPRAELVEAVSTVMNGRKYVSPALTEILSTDLERDTDRPPHELLSNREFEVLRFIGQGKTVSEIAGLLALSDKTISTFRARILKKMGMKHNAELAHYAIRNKLVD